MPKIVVYQYEAYDPAARRWYVTDRMGTEEAIQLAGGVPLRRTALAIDGDRVDAKGFLIGSPDNPN